MPLSAVLQPGAPAGMLKITAEGQKEPSPEHSLRGSGAMVAASCPCASLSPPSPWGCALQVIENSTLPVLTLKALLPSSFLPRGKDYQSSEAAFGCSVSTSLRAKARCFNTGILNYFWCASYPSARDRCPPEEPRQAEQWAQENLTGSSKAKCKVCIWDMEQLLSAQAGGVRMEHSPAIKDLVVQMDCK